MELEVELEREKEAATAPQSWIQLAPAVGIASVQPVPNCAVWRSGVEEGVGGGRGVGASGRCLRRAGREGRHWVWEGEGGGEVFGIFSKIDY